ncbi:unnamed protein product [Trifolium pratense]|uniref:Uncharacterized protein n=1 Tax=Trifolium pratense TaxID=57577 RepID=A0ACB0LRQ6_TRIPR|nr:unnamed protein product [Trifolium pratense]
MATDPNNSSSIIETTPPPPTPTSTQTHPALTVPNITNFIKITLSMEKGTYNTWSELFKIHARVFQVIDHIIPSTEPSAIPSLKTIDPSLWRRLDAVVLQWIYGTISEDLLNIIIEQDSTAETAWNRLFEIFYDNKNSRALYLEQEFSRTRMEQFSDASSYCQHLKSLFDQMANVGTSISKERLVLQLISGLTDAYAAVGSQIRHAAILPDFYKARSMIILEETALQKKVSNSVDNTALMASNNETSADHTSSRPNRGGSNNNHGGRSNGRGHRGRGRGQNHGRGGDDQWYMDTGATSHMTANEGFSDRTTFNEIAHITTQFEREIECFQCDNGKEYDNTSFKNICEQNGMSFRFSCPHTSPQNGKAERKVRTINNIIRTLLAHASLPPSMWHHALQMTTYLHNILPNKKFSLQSPTKILYQKDPSYSHLRVFGCLCYPLIPSTSRHKLQPRSTPCIFLGYPSNHRGYKCYELSSRKIFISRHIFFEENTFPLANSNIPNTVGYNFLDNDTPFLPSHTYTTPTQNNSTTTSPPNPTFPPSNSPSSSNTPFSSNSPPAPLHNHISPNTTSTSSTTSTPTNQSQHHNPPTIPPHSPQMTTRSQHGIVKLRKLFILHTSNKTSISPLPTNPIGALNDHNWKLAMQDEYNALIENKTWELVPRPSNANIIRSMWIFRHKKNLDGSFERYKARLVGNGANQQTGIDCGETFSPVVKPATIRTVLSVAISKSWCLHQLDVKNAFLHGNLDETVHMHQPPGFRHPQFPDHVCLLKKSLYGLKQASRAWYQRFTDYVATMGFSHSMSDHSLFIYHHDNDIAYILLYVDDIILAASSNTLRKSIMAQLSSEFAMKDLGPLSYFLGISVNRHSKGLFLSQKKYAEEIIERAGMSSCKPSPTPVDTKAKLSSTSGNPYHDPTEYRSLAGALQYLTFTIPDISYVVQQVCLFMHDPKTHHMSALKRIIRYVHGTIDFGLHLYPSSIDKLISYTDTDWAGCPDTRRSTSGYCVYLGDNLISWSVKRQPTLSRSSAEAEYRV